MIYSAEQRAHPIACEKTAHCCRMMELDPKYADVIPARELVIQGVVVAVFRKA